MSVHSRPSIQYKNGMALRDRKLTKDCTQSLRIGNIRALNGKLSFNIVNTDCQRQETLTSPMSYDVMSYNVKSYDDVVGVILL